MTLIAGLERRGSSGFKHHIFLTGPPRVGKTTVILRVVEELRAGGVKVGGMVSEEIREMGVRVGFRIIDLDSGAKGILAHVSQRSGPSIGKYRVCLEDLEGIGVKAILNACEKASIIVIDEVGPMELYSSAFKAAVLRALDSGKRVLGTIHYRVSSEFTNLIKGRADTSIIEVTYENRDRLPKTIVNELMGRVFG
ncbi:MAG: NTPase [Candidatus Bathyarchaeia archaeon]